MGAEISRADIFAAVTLTAALIILAGVIGRRLAERIGQPTVLGELLIGILVGNIGYWLQEPTFILIMHLSSVSQIFTEVWTSGLSIPEATQGVFHREQLIPGGLGARLNDLLIGPQSPALVVTGMTLWLFANLGVLFLLFMAGLESSVAELRQLGRQPVYVATVGVITPFLLGLAIAFWLLPSSPIAAYFFVAATLCNTSIGISARVFRDLHKFQTPEAKTVLEAAVLDDILGVMILVVILGVVTTGEVRLLHILSLLLLAVLFLGVVFIAGDWLAARGLRIFRALDQRTYKLLYPVVLVFSMAWLANLVGLTAIIGAFAVGLILRKEQLTNPTDSGPTLKELLAPIELFLVPVFFVLIGMQVNLGALLEPGVPWLVVALVIAAVLGKLAVGYAVGPGLDRLVVGLGMLPRGEVTLIFASIGKGLGVIPDPVFSALVLMTVITALVTPLGLRWSFAWR